MMKDDDVKLLRGFADRQTNRRTNERTDICDCRVAFVTENGLNNYNYGKFWPNWTFGIKKIEKNEKNDSNQNFQIAISQA